MKQIPVDQVDWNHLETDGTLRDEDVVAFSIAQNGKTEFVHFGKIIQQDGRNRLISKLGLGPIVIGSLENTAAEYEGQFSELQIYRKK